MVFPKVYNFAWINLYPRIVKLSFSKFKIFKFKGKGEAIRQTLASELTPIAGFPICVTEGHFIPIHNKVDNIIEVPLHVYGNGTKKMVWSNF